MALADDVMIPFSRDYHVVTVSNDSRSAWRWEIRRRSAPMGVRLNGDGYLSQRAAEEAGKRALETFLAALTSEERRG
jgi:hypothetical protein